MPAFFSAICSTNITTTHGSQRTTLYTAFWKANASACNATFCCSYLPTTSMSNKATLCEAIVPTFIAAFEFAIHTAFLSAKWFALPTAQSAAYRDSLHSTFVRAHHTDFSTITSAFKATITTT